MLKENLLSENSAIADTNLTVTDKLIPEESFICPISHEIMVYPVLLVGDGHTYDRNYITLWLQHSNISPVTQEELTSKALIPNFSIKSMIYNRYPEIENQYKAQVLEAETAAASLARTARQAPVDAGEAYRELISNIAYRYNTAHYKLQEHDKRDRCWFSMLIVLQCLAFGLLSASLVTSKGAPPSSSNGGLEPLKVFYIAEGLTIGFGLLIMFARYSAKVDSGDYRELYVERMNDAQTIALDKIADLVQSNVIPTSEHLELATTSKLPTEILTALRRAANLPDEEPPASPPSCWARIFHSTPLQQRENERDIEEGARYVQ